MATKEKATVVRLPRLPRVPEPPQSGMDVRQSQFRRIVGNLGAAIGGHVALSTANVQSGYPASAPDVGRLKDALERGLARFDMVQVRARWDDDVFDWLRLSVKAWVQRCKMLQIRPRRNGIQIRLLTQDDHGYYRYEFDVFPGKRTRKRMGRT
jgi:hypothetical protein